MIVNSAKEYRTWYKSQKDRMDVDENFMGCRYGKKKGLFNLFHGEKEDIERYLPSLLDIAEDNQAIYEFLQNAVDCGATHFWAFYNDEYFLAVNNGSKFTLDGLSSILNIAQSTKTTASSIGRLGIGFKLAHRLVGKGNGTYELIHGNKGPIMFSWDDASQLKALMSSEEIHCEGLDENAFLLKIAITNFPADIEECVKDIRYNDVVVFPNSELKEMREYTSECLDTLFEQNSTDFKCGTIFFIKLGEKKRELLDADLNTLKNGIEYSMNTLKQLNRICFNGEDIVKKRLIVNATEIGKTSERFKEIDPQYKDYPIQYSFGFLPLDFDDEEYYKAVEQLRQSPNFYKYFPMGDEVDNMALFVHSDSFQIEANRRKLTNHHTNRELFKDIAFYIIKTLNRYKSIGGIKCKKYLQLYASILLTDKPASQEKAWMHSVFFDPLFSAITNCIPIKTLFPNNGVQTDSSKVIIKKVGVNIPLCEIGHKDKRWFYWSGEAHKEIIAKAKEKLCLDEWNINDIITNANTKLLNEWLEKISDELFDSFIGEIKATTTSNDAKRLLPNIKLFKFGKERKSQFEIDANVKYVISTTKITNVKVILEKCGMKCTDVLIESHPLSSLLGKTNEKKLFEDIKTVVETNCQILNALDKFELVSVLSGFENVTDSMIKQLRIFKNEKNEYCCLGRLLAYTDHVEAWKSRYVICKEENFTEIQKYMVSDKDFYTDLIGEDYENIVEEGTSIKELYQIYQKNGQPWSSDLTIKMINKYGASEDMLWLVEQTSDKSSVEKFITKMDSLALTTDANYAPSSYAYRCIQIAAKVDATTLRQKITVDGIKLTDFSSSDTLSFNITINNICQCYKIKLSDVLPNDTQCAIYGKIALKFSSITGYETIFSADSSDKRNVTLRLQKILEPDGVLITPAQFAFKLLVSAEKGYFNTSGYSYDIVRLVNNSQIAGIIDYCYENGLFSILAAFKNLKPWINFVKGKYLFSSEYTLEEERADTLIEEWCGQDEGKKKALIALGMHFDDSAEIKRRIAFKNDTLTEWNTELRPMPFFNWVCSLKPVTGDNQKKLLTSICGKYGILQKIFYEEDFSNAKELNTEKYNSWKTTDGIRIYTLYTEMPYRVVFNKTDILCTGQEGDHYYFKDNKHLYIKGIEDSDFVSVLAKVHSQSSIPFSYPDFVSVCIGSYEEQKAKDEEIEQLRLEKAKLEEIVNGHKENNRLERFDEYREEYTERIKEFMGADFSMPSDKVMAEHIISSYRILMYVKSLGSEFTIKEDFDEREYIKSDHYATILLANGKKVHAQGAKYGIWYLSQPIWEDVVENKNYVCLCTGNGEYDFSLIKDEKDIQSIAESTKNVFMRLTATADMDIMETIKSVYSPSVLSMGDGIAVKEICPNRDVHLMLLVHATPNEKLNSMFDTVFKSEGEEGFDFINGDY